MRSSWKEGAIFFLVLTSARSIVKLQHTYSLNMHFISGAGLVVFSTYLSLLQTFGEFVIEDGVLNAS